MDIREHLAAIEAAKTEYDQAWITFRQQYESGSVNPTTAIAGLDRAERILKNAKIAFADDLLTKKNVLSDIEAFRDSINQVWSIVTGEAPDTWDYPGQVIRATQQMQATKVTVSTPFVAPDLVQPFIDENTAIILATRELHPANSDRQSWGESHHLLERAAQQLSRFNMALEDQRDRTAQP